MRTDKSHSGIQETAQAIAHPNPQPNYVLKNKPEITTGHQ